VVPFIIAVFFGERPGALAVLGILLGLAAIVLVSQQTVSEAEPHAAEPHARPGGGRLPAGVGIALVSGVAIGFFFLCLARTRPEAGMWPILASRGTSVTLFGLAAIAGGRSLRLPGVLLLTLLCGMVDMSANALYLLAARIGPLSVMVTLSSLYPASTVLLARLVLGERLNARQIAGVGCALAAIVLIVSGGAR
jgi:drug/metabolite transporter (DMT)-like permease